MAAQTQGILMANKVVVLAIFKDEGSADAAAETVKESGLARHDAIGVLVLNEKGEVKAEKVGKRSVGKGAGIGLALALVTPVGLGVGILAGGGLGALHHKGLGLDKADRVVRRPRRWRLVSGGRGRRWGGSRLAR
jgi:hypothetical protein